MSFSMSDKTELLLRKMVVGTAQFGLDYGFNTATAKKVTQEDCNEMLDVSRANHITMLDTAEAYGDAIDKISLYHSSHEQKFEIISKFLSADDVLKPLRNSLHKLAIDRYHTILAHKSQDLFSNRSVQNDLTELKNSGQTKYIGVSIYTNEEFQQAIDCEFVDLIQFPFNLLDNMSQRGELMIKAKKAGKILHARSVYLQGMFLKEFPLPLRLKPLESYLQRLKDLCRDNNISMISLCLEYVFKNDMIENVIVGQHRPAQLRSNVDLIKNFKGGAYLKDVDDILVKEAELLSPRNW